MVLTKIGWNQFLVFQIQWYLQIICHSWQSSNWLKKGRHLYNPNPIWGKKQKSCFKHFLSFWITTTSHFTFAATKMTRRHQRDMDMDVTWVQHWHVTQSKNCVPTVYEMQSYVDNLRCTHNPKKDDHWMVSKCTDYLSRFFLPFLFLQLLTDHLFVDFNPIL